MNPRYLDIDVDYLLDLLLYSAIVYLILEWATASSESTGAYTVDSQGDGPVVLTDRSLEHLEDGGTIDVDRWHGGTMHLEAYQTADVDSEGNE